MKENLWMLWHKNKRTIMAIFLFAAIVCGIQGYHLQQTYAEEVLRFHVLANSNSKEDQRLKLQVRDAVGTYVSGLLKDVDDKAETTEIVQKHMKEIKKIAEREVKKEGYTYPIYTALEETDFPEKHYGKYHMPAGKYTALRVEIGEAKGHNWWCVMYPNMCFAGSAYEVVEKEEKEQMYEVFTLYEYEKLIEAPEKQVRFRYLR